MFTNLFIKIIDLDAWKNGEEIIAADKGGLSIIFRCHDGDLMEVMVPVESIKNIELVESTGFVKGTFNKFIIQKNN